MFWFCLLFSFQVTRIWRCAAPKTGEFHCMIHALLRSVVVSVFTLSPSEPTNFFLWTHLLNFLEVITVSDSCGDGDVQKHIAEASLRIPSAQLWRWWCPEAQTRSITKDPFCSCWVSGIRIQQAGTKAIGVLGFILLHWGSCLKSAEKTPGSLGGLYNQGEKLTGATSRASLTCETLTLPSGWFTVCLQWRKHLIGMILFHNLLSLFLTEFY